MKVQEKIQKIEKKIGELDLEIHNLFEIRAYKLHQHKIDERNGLISVLNFLKEH